METYQPIKPASAFLPALSFHAISHSLMNLTNFFIEIRDSERKAELSAVSI